MSGSVNDRPFVDDEAKCAHNVVRRKRGEPHLYVCGSCATLFTVQEEKEHPEVREAMFDRRPPWGFRNRQA